MCSPTNKAKQLIFFFITIAILGHKVSTLAQGHCFTSEKEYAEQQQKQHTILALLERNSAAAGQRLNFLERMVRARSIL